MYRNILVAVDDSEKSKLALNSAIHSAVVFNSKLTICHIKKIPLSILQLIQLECYQPLIFSNKISQITWMKN